MSSFEVSQQLTAPPFAQQLEQLRLEFTRAQAMVSNVIAELEADLQRMRGNDKIPHDIIVKKDEQIETLVKFNNTVDDLFTTYKLMTTNMRADLMATNMMLWDALKSQQTAFEVLMKRIVTIPKHLR